MATSKTWRTVGTAFSGLFLGSTGSWLLVICVGGLLTLGALSLFHLGVLLSVGAMGLCFLVAGVCLLYRLMMGRTPSKDAALKEDVGEQEAHVLRSALPKKSADVTPLHPLTRQSAHTGLSTPVRPAVSYNPFGSNRV